MPIEIADLIPQATEPITSRWRCIRTPIPVPQSVPLIERLRRAEPISMAGMPPVLWHEADGFLVRDTYGNQWIDLTSGIVLANAGHSHPRILAAIRQATDQRLLATYAFPSVARLELLEKLVGLSPIPDAKAILYSAGTEATECAMSLMRRHGQRIHPKKTAIVSLEGHYHGRTLAANLASGTSHPDDWISRERVQHFQIPFPQDDASSKFDSCLASLAKQGIKPQEVAGIILEPVPGTTTQAIPSEFAAHMFEWAKTNDVLITFDEIQCGCGRTGKLFACEHFDFVPDLIAMGKGLSSSLPVSAVLGRRELLDQTAPGNMSSTHGGNPICAAAALANLQVIEDERLVEASARTGEQVLERLRSLQRDFPRRIRSVQGLGLFISIHFKRPDNEQPDIAFADAIAMEAVRSGVLMFTTGRGYLKFTPPLSIDPEAAFEAVDVLRECVERRS